MWDSTDADPEAQPKVLPGHENWINFLALSPDGHWLATGSQDITVRLWELTGAEPAPKPQVLRGHEGSIRGLAFSLDGRWLATGSDDGTVRLWRLNLEDLIQHAQGVVGRRLTDQEREIYGISPP